MNRLMIAILVFLGSLAFDANAGLLSLARKGASAAGKVAHTVAVAPRVLLSASRAGRPMHTLRSNGGRIYASDAAGREVLVAAAAGTGVLGFTDEGAALLRGIDLAISEADLPEYADFLKKAAKLDPDREIRVVRADESIGRALVKQSQGRSVLIAEQYKGVFVEVGAHQADELAWALQQPLQHGDIKVISLFDKSDADVLRQLDDSVGDLHRPSGQVSPAALTEAIRSQKQQALFVVGHVEGDSFVVRDAAGLRKSAVRIDELQEAAREADSVIFMLGCETGLCSMSSGPIAPVNASKLAQGLKQAIHRPTVGEALSDVSTAGGDMLVKPDIIDPLRTVLRAEQKTDAAQGRTATVVRVGLLSRARSQELASRLVPMIPSWIQFPYLVGLVALAFSIREVRRDWRTSRLPAPRFGYRPGINLAVHGLRALGFIVLMPFAALVSWGMLFMAWGLSLASVIELSSAVTAVAAVFGWRAWRMYEEQTAGQAWFRRFWIIMVFCAAVPWASSLAFELLHDLIPHPVDSEPDWLVFGAPVLLAAAIAWSLFALLKRVGRNPNDLLQLTLTAPLRAVELLATRLITHTRRSEIAQ